MMQLKSIDRHRNGVCGVPFHVAIVKDGRDEMLIVRFDKSADEQTGGIVCAAFNLSQLDKRNIQFGENSFRGDYYADTFMDSAVAKWEAGIEAKGEAELAAWNESREKE